MLMSSSNEPAPYDLGPTCKANAQTIREKRNWVAQRMRLNQFVHPFEVEFFFAEKVREGGQWDLKREIGWNTLRTVYIDGKKYYIDGEDIGNIHYGYVGRASGFSSETLQRAGGVVQMLQGHSKPEFKITYGDDPKDNAAIRRGIAWYDSGIFK